MQRDGVALVATGAARAFPWPILAVTLLVQTAASFTNQGISPLAPFIQADLKVTREQVGLLVTALYLGSVLSVLPGGWTADRFGVRLMFGIGLAFVGGGAVAMSLSPFFGLLLLSAILGGLGNGVALPPTTRAIMNWFPQRTRGLAMSIKQTGVALAGATMAWTVPLVASTWGWRGTLVIVGAIGLCAAAIAVTTYREPMGAKAAASPRKAGPRLGEVVRNRPLLLASCVATVYGLVQLCVITFLVLLLTERFRYPVVIAGVLLGWAQMAGVLARVVWGGVSDTIFGGARRIVLTIIGVLTALTTLGLSLLPSSAPLWLVAALVVGFGLSGIGWNGVHMTFVAELAGRELSATAAAFSLLLIYIGIMVGPPLFGRIVDATGSYPLALQGLSAMTALAVLLLQTVRAGRPRGAA